MSINPGQNILAADVKFRGARVYQTAGTSLSSSSFTVLPFAAENFDTTAFHDNVTNNSRLTIPAGMGGKYMIGCTVKCNNSNEKSVILQLNGTTQIGAGAGAEPSGSTLSGITVMTVFDLAAGDYVEVLASSDSASTSGDVDTHFWLMKIID